MNKVFTQNGWADYVYWQTEDRKTLKKINSLIEDVCRNGNQGIGKPEPLTVFPARPICWHLMLPLKLPAQGKPEKDSPSLRNRSAS